MKKKFTRRQIIGAGLSAGVLCLRLKYCFGAKKILYTPTDDEGPFYPQEAQKNKDFDLTKV